MPDKNKPKVDKPKVDKPVAKPQPVQKPHVDIR